MPHPEFDEFGFTTRQFTGQAVQCCPQCGELVDDCFCDDFWLTEEDRYFE